MNKVAIFPYDYKFLPILENLDAIKEVSISKVLSFKSWGYVGRCISALSEEAEYNLVVEDVFEMTDTTAFHAFMLIDSEHDLDEQYLYQVIEDMSAQHKDVWILKKLERKQLEKIKSICRRNNVKIKLLLQSDGADGTDSAELLKNEDEILYDINIPIIAVAGIGENTNKIKVQLNIYKALYKDTYKVMWISSRDEAILFNGHSFPEFMIKSGLSEKKKILMFNHYMKWIEEVVKPDVILIGIPGGIMPDSKKQVGNFGITAFELFNAVNPDYFILSLYCDDINETYLKELSNIAKYKLNAVVDAFYISEVAQDAYSLNKISPVEYIYLGNKKVEDKVNKLQCRNINIYSQGTLKSLYEDMITKLSEYGEYQAL